MTAEEFSGIDLALGTVRGFREWKLTVEGRLLPLSYSSQTTWTPGENLAECFASPKEEDVPRVVGEDYKVRAEKVAAWKADHDYESCAHGFYAFFKSTEPNHYGGSAPTIAGVIEGYGEVLIGTKGFRAMKARILALSIEGHEGIWALEPFVVDRLRRNYPGVAIFESSLAMGAEFPADAPATFATVESV